MEDLPKDGGGASAVALELSFMTRLCAVSVGCLKSPSPERVVWVLQWYHTPLWGFPYHPRVLRRRWTAITWLRKCERSKVRIVGVVRQALMGDF